MTAWFRARPDDFKKVFKHAQSPQGKNYLTVYRPFTPNIFVDNVNINCEELLSAPFSFAGNRIQEQCAHHKVSAAKRPYNANTTKMYSHNTTKLSHTKTVAHDKTKSVHITILLACNIINKGQDKLIK